jgi:hypothetical protein
MAELLTSIQTGSGTPVFESYTSEELQQRIDVFASDSQFIVDDIGVNSLFAFSSDVMVVKEKNNLEFALDVFEQKTSGPRAESESGSPTPDGPKRSKSSTITSYDYYQKGTYASVETALRYNYNMTTASVDTTFTNILGNIIQELKPPKTSTTFTYDFKFSQNRNGTLSGSSGGGY